VHPGELDTVLDAFAAARAAAPALRLVLAPRHLDRAAGWAERLRARGWSVAERSAGATDAACDVLLLDTHGELASFLAASTVAFIGGTLVPVGGHNPLEASAAGVPVALGVHQANIRDEAARLVAAGAAVTVSDPTELAAAVRSWCDPASRGDASGAALRVVAELAGAGARAVAWLEERGVLRASRG